MEQTFFDAPPTYPRLAAKLAELKRDFPFLQWRTAGRSVLNRELFGITLGNPARTVLFAGGIHAQEWISTLLLIRYLEELAVCCREEKPFAGFPVREALSRQGLTVVPMVNPDGVSIALEGPASAGPFAGLVEELQAKHPTLWQANAHGVDLNHNFDAGFSLLRQLEQEAGITGPAPRQYGGPFPHSEPETAAMAALADRPEVESVFAFHAQGEELYYRYGPDTPPKGQLVAGLLAGLSGYRLIENSGLCSHGGYKDYVIAKCRKPGYTVELGRGENPLPLSALDGIWHKTKRMLLAATLL